MSDPYARAEERRLIERVLARDESAFRTLYRNVTPQLYRLALRWSGGVETEAEDLVQETWRRAVRSLRDFEGRSALSTWLGGILIRCASERRRARKRTLDFEAGEMTGGRIDSPPPHGAVLDLERAFAALPEGFREVLLLHDVEGYRHTDIAEMLGIAPGTSKSQLSRARARVRELLGEDYART